MDRFNRRLSVVAGAVVACVYLAPAAAIDIDGVKAGGLDQPRVNLLLRRDPLGAPLPSDLLFDFNFSALLDTGASGIVLSDFRAFDHAVARATYLGEDVKFSDTGSTGPVEFFVSEDLNIDIANFEPSVNPLLEANYTHDIGPLRAQIAEPATNPFLVDVNIVGMPAMIGKVVVMDPKPLDRDTLTLMNTFIYDPGTPPNPSDPSNPGIPVTNRHIDLSFANFDRFSELNTADTNTPVPASENLGSTLNHNPFIGADPVTLLDGGTDDTPGITIALDGNQTTGSFLLDTGSAGSFISNALAADLNIRYVAGTEGTAGAALEMFNPNNPGAAGTLIDFFTTEVTGVSGPELIAGFFVDSLLLPTREAGDPFDGDDPNNIRFLNAAVFVTDISISDGVDTITLDGVFGMNFLVDSVDPNDLFGDVTEGAFDWIVFDEPNGTLGVQVVPIPPSLALFSGGIALLGLRRRQAHATA